MQIFHRDLTERKLTPEKVFNWFNICSVSLKSQFKRDQMVITYGVENLLRVNTSTCSKMVLPFPLYMLRFWMTYFLRSGCMFLIWVSPGSFFIGYKFETLKRFISHSFQSSLSPLLGYPNIHIHVPCNCIENWIETGKYLFYSKLSQMKPDMHIITY